MDGWNVCFLLETIELRIPHSEGSVKFVISVVAWDKTSVVGPVSQKSPSIKGFKIFRKPMGWVGHECHDPVILRPDLIEAQLSTYFRKPMGAPSVNAADQWQRGQGRSHGWRWGGQSRQVQIQGSILGATIAQRFSKFWKQIFKLKF